MSREVALHLPNPELMTDEYAAKFEVFAATSLDQFRAEMVDPTLVGYGSMAIRLPDLRHPDEADSKRAIVVPLPYGNSYTPAMHIRARAIQAFAPEGTRVLVVPNNTRKEQYYSLEGHEQNDGIELLGNMILRACSELGIEELAVAACSQGAGPGASMMVDAGRYNINVKAAYLSDPANVAPDRSPKALKKDFMGTGLGNLNRAINDSGIDALSRTQRSRGRMDSVVQLAGLLAVARNAGLLENKMLHDSMANNTFVYHLDQVFRQGNFVSDGLMVTRFADSKICTENIVADMVSVGLGSNIEVVEGYGHEGGDNVTDAALRAIRTFTDGGFYAKAA